MTVSIMMPASLKRVELLVSDVLMAVAARA
jgi:hypothetical protein